MNTFMIVHAGDVISKQICCHLWSFPSPLLISLLFLLFCSRSCAYSASLGYSRPPILKHTFSWPFNSHKIHLLALFLLFTDQNDRFPCTTLSYTSAGELPTLSYTWSLKTYPFWVMTLHIGHCREDTQGLTHWLMQVWKPVGWVEYLDYLPSLAREIFSLRKM